MSNYTAPPYEPTSPIVLFGDVPRFGHTDDLAQVISGQSSYLSYGMGIAFIPGLILILFMIWLIAIAVFKACGRKVGLLSGHKMKGERPHWLVRTSVMLSAAFALAAGSMYLMTATSSLYDTFYSIRDGAKNLADLAGDITEIADDLIVSGEFTTPIRDNLVDLIDAGVCSSFTTGNNNTIDIDPKAEEAVVVLTDLNDFIGSELVDLKENFSTRFEVIEKDVNGMLDTAQGYARISYYAIGIISLSSLLYIGAYLAWFGPKWMTLKTYFCFQTYIVLPLYFLTLVLTAHFTAGIGATLVVNSDMCTSGENNSPESLLKAVLDSQGVTGVAREPIDYYVIDGCDSTFSGNSELDKLVNDLESAHELCTDLKQVINADLTTFETACGGYPGSLDPLLVSLDATKIAVGAFLVVGYKAQSLLSCKRLNSIYIGLAHGAVCEHMPETLAWMFCTMAIIMFSGMILFTFRAALLPDKAVELEEIDDVYENKYTPSFDKSEPSYASKFRTQQRPKYQHTGPSVSTFTTNSEYRDYNVSMSTGIGSEAGESVNTSSNHNVSISTGIGSEMTQSVDSSSQNSSTDVGLNSYNNGGNKATEITPVSNINDNNTRAQTAPASMDVLNNNRNTNDVKEVEDEVEVMRLPTEDVDDVEIQVSQRSLVVDETK